MIDHLAHDVRALGAKTRTCWRASCVDLRISEIVDAGQYVVSALLPLAVFTKRG